MKRARKPTCEELKDQIVQSFAIGPEMLGPDTRPSAVKIIFETLDRRCAAAMLAPARSKEK